MSIIANYDAFLDSVRYKPTPKFKVGDRVALNHRTSVPGLRGTLVYYRESAGAWAIEFDKKCIWSGTCEGYVPSGLGAWITEGAFDLIHNDGIDNWV